MARGSSDNVLALAEQAAQTLREAITAGDYAPGVSLVEATLTAELGVSRNTLREAFGKLAAEGLIIQQLYRGASVRILSAEEIREIYTIRRTLELRGIEESVFAVESEMAVLQAAVAAQTRASVTGEWRDAGTFSLYFHREIVRLLHSARLDVLFQTVVAQLRLAFSLANDEEAFQRPWLARDQELCALIVSGRRAEASRAAELYLHDSERVVLDVARSAPARLLRRPSGQGQAGRAVRARTTVARSA